MKRSVYFLIGITVVMITIVTTMTACHPDTDSGIAGIMKMLPARTMDLRLIDLEKTAEFTDYFKNGIESIFPYDNAPLRMGTAWYVSMMKTSTSLFQYENEDVRSFLGEYTDSCEVRAYQGIDIYHMNEYWPSSDAELDVFSLNGFVILAQSGQAEEIIDISSGSSPSMYDSDRFMSFRKEIPSGIAAQVSSQLVYKHQLITMAIAVDAGNSDDMLSVKAIYDFARVGETPDPVDMEEYLGDIGLMNIHMSKKEMVFTITGKLDASEFDAFWHHLMYLHLFEKHPAYD